MGATLLCAGGSDSLTVFVKVLYQAVPTSHSKLTLLDFLILLFMCLRFSLMFVEEAIERKP